ncbi:WD40-repeat-containing domain protein [Lasiosphaeria ovina]|uniref:WD40-repeat-containing domain protein n=1 Tax=Lasiosphaeria ovina TaxID=92902 RepID=A0AAE0KCX2_9PEZI|nr:WD40-repeat-containing domain protein [Lasiosphaeria ovina]
MADDKLPSGAPKTSATLSGNLLSSPPRAPPSQGSRERRNPSITPRKFRRFFTPRSRVSSNPSAVRTALRDLTAPALNRCQTPSSPLKPISEELTFDDLPSLHDAQQRPKRRKVQHDTPDRLPSYLPSPLDSSPALLPTPELRRGPQSPIRSLQARRSAQDDLDMYDSASEDNEDEEAPVDQTSYKTPIPLHRRGLGGQLLQRMTGSLSRANDRALLHPVADWRSETANFYTKPEDAHSCTSHEGAPRSIPFCTASCNKCSLVAVGDEEGYVRLLDSDKDFSKIHLSFPAHGNAIIDLAFSDDDYLLATASGDQTGRVIDMMTQTPISILGHHTASLKQVRFQPGRGSNCVLATSGRDGSVQIWDLRCQGGPVQEIAPIRSEAGLHHRSPQTVNSGCVVNSIYDAHARISRKDARAQSSSNSATGPSGDVARIGEVPGRIGEVSVTALQFLPPGREHLLLTACEADASIKLWDIRAVHTSRNHKHSTPVSFTAPPASHVAWRPFGISSMTLGGDGSRLYALCKDNTVYTYSTAHLVLGHAAELAAAPPGADPPRRRHHHHGTAHQGLGPLYGFRHPLLHATSFYVKSSLRPARDGLSELLAVGSSDGCTVLFPTDERYVREAWEPRAKGEQEGDEEGTAEEDENSYLVGESTAGLPVISSSRSRRPGLLGSSGRSLVRTNSMTNIFAARQADAMPVVRRGTPLVRGHDKEVGAMTWTSTGKLITVGDDYLIRCWSEDREAASDLRLGGETGGRRWGCGWADVGDAWDGDKDDW